MSKDKLFIISLVIIIGLTVSLTLAQTAPPAWFTVDNGGGTSTNSRFGLVGSIGQVDASQAAKDGNGRYQVVGGFWAGLSSATYTLAGRITDSAGKPAVGLRVFVYEGDTAGSMSNPYRIAVTDETGQYTVTGLRAGTYSLQPTGKRYLDCPFDYQFSPASSSVQVSANNTPNRDFTISYTSLTGRVTNADNGAGLSGATVALHYVGANRCVQFAAQTTQTDGNGNYRFEGLPFMVTQSLPAGFTSSPFWMRVTKGNFQNYSGYVNLTGLTNTKNVALTPVVIEPEKPTVCTVPFFSQNDPRWKYHPLRTAGQCDISCSTIGSCGCTLTSAAMLFNFYGATSITPPVLSDRMGTKACYFNWWTAANNSEGKASYENKYGLNYLGSKFIQDQRPVILKMTHKTKGWTHWVLLVKGTGNDPNSYLMHDPWYTNGANMAVSTRSGSYNFNLIAVYNGTPNCTARSNNLPESSGPSPVEIYPRVTALSSTTVISGNLAMYRMDVDETEKLTLTVQLTATSQVGDVTEMLLWSDTLSNTMWMPFNQFVSLPSPDDLVYVQFRDDQGNLTDVYSDTINPAGPPSAPESVYLPIVIK